MLRLWFGPAEAKQREPYKNPAFEGRGQSGRSGMVARLKSSSRNADFVVARLA